MDDGPTTLPRLFATGAAAGPDAPLLEIPGATGRSLTYGTAARAVSRGIDWLRAAGVARGDRVAVIMDKSPVALILYLATLGVGAVHLPLNPASTDDEVAYVLGDAEPRLVVADRPPPLRRGGAPVARWCAPEEVGGEAASAEQSPVVADDPAVLLYTSGTTGRPKGALLSHGNLAANAVTLRQAWGFVPEDRLLHALPIFHAHGLLVGVNVTLAAGSSLRWLERFSPESVVDALPGCSVFMGVPTYYTRLLADHDRSHALGDAARPLRLFVSGSAPLSAAIHEAWERRTGHRILERYGMTETVMLCSNPLHGERRAGTVGPPLPGVEVRLVDTEKGSEVAAGTVGAIEVRGPSVFTGYWRRAELGATEFAPGGWFRTGDLGSWDADGYLTIVGRAKDLVISGGMNVYPKEVEDALEAQPGVAEAAVVGVADPDLGEIVAAVVVAEPGERLDGDDLRQAVRRRLAGYKVPKSIAVVDRLPRNVMGKVDKPQLRRRLVHEHSA